MTGAGPLVGRTVAIVHPAWHACGTATVVASQAGAYRALGARVLSIGLSDQPVYGLAPAGFASAYLDATPELVADRRLLTGMNAAALLNPLSIAPIGARFARGDHAATYVSFARNSAVPGELAAERIDLIHCNHFFCMPLAEALRGDRGCPIVLDTHDVQARQYVLRNESGWYLPPRARYNDLLATELHWLRRADLLLHLNSEEATAFRSLLPDNRHALVYPAVDPVPPGPGGDDLVIVASANVPNVLSLLWFYREIVPLAGDPAIAVYGNVQDEIRRRDPALYKRFAGHFRGRVGNIAEAYANAARVLLPTIKGHGLSIKTVEALASGAPLIGTHRAFRGIDIDPESLGNVVIADDAPAFAAALRQAAGQAGDPISRRDSPTRRFYDAHFSPAAYQAALSRVVLPLLA